MSNGVARVAILYHPFTSGLNVFAIHTPTRTVVPSFYVSGECERILFLVMKGEKERLILNECWSLPIHSCIFFYLFEIIHKYKRIH